MVSHLLMPMLGLEDSKKDDNSLIAIAQQPSTAAVSAVLAASAWVSPASGGVSQPGAVVSPAQVEGILSTSINTTFHTAYTEE